MEAHLTSLPPVPDSPSPTDTGTLSWPGSEESSTAQGDEDRALVANEVIEAVALAVLDVQEQERQKEEEHHGQQQEPFPLETTSRDLSPIETRLERGDQQSAGEELETSTQVFQTPISPSHTGVVGYQSPVQEESAELPLLEALGWTTAPLASSKRGDEEQKFVPKVEEDPKTEVKFQPQLEEQTEERFAPAVERELAVPGLAVTKPTMEMGGNEVVLSEEEIEEIQRSPIRAPGTMPFFRSLITVNTSPFTYEGDGKPIIYASPVSSSNAGPRTAISPPDGFGAGYWEEIRPQQPVEEGAQRRQSHRQPVAIHPSIEHILVPTPVGVMTSEDESSSSSATESDDPPPGRATYPLTDLTSIASHNPRPRPSFQSTQPSPADSRPPAPRKGQHASTTYPGEVPRVSGRTIVSSMVSNQRPAPISGAGARKAASSNLSPSAPRQEESKPSVDELIQMLKERLREEDSFRYVLKGVLAEHEEVREGSRREERSVETRAPGRQERQSVPVPIRKLSEKTPPSFFVQTDSESELEFDLGGRQPHRTTERKRSPTRAPRRQHQRSRSRGPTSVPTSRSAVIPPAALSALSNEHHLASLTPRRINPPPFHDPRDIAIAKKISPSSSQVKSRASRRSSHTKKTKAHAAPPPLIRPTPIHPLSTTLPPRTPSISPETATETKAFVPHSATVALVQLAREAEALTREAPKRKEQGSGGKSKSDREGRGKSGGDGKKGSFYRAGAPREGVEKPQRRHTIDQVREIEGRRKHDGGEGERERRAERELGLKISRAGGSGVATRKGGEGPKHSSPKKAALQASTNRLPPPRSAPAVAGRSSGGGDKAGYRVWKRKGKEEAKEEKRRETYHFASYSFDDFA